MTQEEKQTFKESLIHEIKSMVDHSEPSPKTLILYGALKEDMSELSKNFALVKHDLDAHVHSEDSLLKHVADDIRYLKEKMGELLPIYEQSKNSRIFIEELKRRTGSTFKWVTWLTGISAFIFLMKEWIRH